MKRFLGTLGFVLLSAAVMAQAPFTIFRPADGSRVRETVKILIPKNSVPEGGYIGIFLGGKFIEATVPPLDKTKKFYEYDLDTKGRKLEDGKVNIEAVLYEDYENQPRIVNRSSVEVTIQNSAESMIPENGIYLRYKWVPGTENIYDLTTRVITDIGDSSKNSIGGRAVETTGEAYNIRLLYSTESKYPNGDGLVRTKFLPEKGKDYAYIVVDPTAGPTKFTDYEMTSVYERLTTTGSEVFGSVPFAVPLEGTSGEAFTTDLFGSYPLPALPARRVKPGQSWQANVQLGSLNKENPYEANRLVDHFIARGEFKDVEWEMGHPCAKIVNSIEVAEPSIESQKLKSQGREFTGNKVQLQETIWFALDRGQVIKVLTTKTVDQEVNTQNNFGGGAPGGNFPGPGSGGPGGMPSSAGQSAAEFTVPGFMSGPIPSYGQMTIGRKGKGAPGSPGGPGGFPGRGNTGGGGVSPSRTTFVRLTLEETFVLEL